MNRSRRTYATLLTQASYLPGVLVLEHGLRAVQSAYPLVVMITPALPENILQVLHNRGLRTYKVDHLAPEEGRFELAVHDSRFADTWTKLRYSQPRVVHSPLTMSGGSNSCNMRYGECKPEGQHLSFL